MQVIIKYEYILDLYFIKAQFFFVMFYVFCCFTGKGNYLNYFLAQSINHTVFYLFTDTK